MIDTIIDGIIPKRKRATFDECRRGIVGHLTGLCLQTDTRCMAYRKRFS